MIDPQSIAFDFDGVVADTMHLFIKIAQDVHQLTHFEYKDFTRYNLVDCIDIEADILTDIVDRIQAGRYIDPLKPIEGAPRVLKRLADRYSPLVFITARSHVGPVGQWLQQTLSLDSSKLDIIPTGSSHLKSEVLTQRGITVFVEDRLETCYLVKNVGVEPLLFKQPWNREEHPFQEVGNWREIEAMINM